MYLSIDQAVCELHARRADRTLRRQVMDYLGGSLADGFPDEPIAILPRHIASCRYEDLLFARQAEAAGLTPYWPTYLKDGYASENPEKRNAVHFKVDRNANHLYRCKLVDDMDRLDRERPCLAGILTNRQDGHGRRLSLQEVHTAMRREVFPDYADNTFDLSEWFAFQAERGGAPAIRDKGVCRYYYAANLAQFILSAIMFEDYHTGPNAGAMAGFHERVLNPALEAVRREFNLQPLIVRLPWEPRLALYPPEALPALVGQPACR